MTTSGWVGLALLLVTALVALPTLVLFAQLLAAALRRDRPDEPPGLAPQRGPLAVLMPAHDEASGIAPAITAVRAQLGARDRLLVVAD
ncbi:MAG: glycosyl transferase, partial [Pseudomonadota bacterium]